MTESKEWLKALADRLAHELTANHAIERFTGNTEIVGDFAEATVRRLIKSAVHPLRVSRGAIIYEGICPDEKGDRVPQIDTIIWSPHPLPPVFEVEDFALVPRSTALAYLEVKKTNYPGMADGLKGLLEREDELVPLVEGRDAWNGDPPPRARGVICLRKHDDDNRILVELEKKRLLFVLLNKSADGKSYEPNAGAMFDLFNFLAKVRLRHRVIEGTIGVNRDLLG